MAYSWLYGVSGDWSTAFDWYGGVPNSGADIVTIATAGVYTVTIGATESFAVGSLNLDYASATLLIDGTLSLTHYLTLTAGTLDLNGTIDGGTIDTKSGTLNIQTGVLNGVKVEGEIRLTNGYANLTVGGGLDMTGILGTGNGTVALNGLGSGLAFDGSQSVAGATIYFGSSAESSGNNYYDATISTSDAGSAATLTLDANVKIIGSGAYAQIFANQADGAIVNNGSIAAAAKGGQFDIGAQLAGFSTPQPGAGAFTNNGSVSVSNGDTLSIESTVFTNNAGATLTAGAGSTLDLGYGAGTVINNGAVSLSTDDTLSIGSAVFNNAAGATLTAGAGSTLDVGNDTGIFTNNGAVSLSTDDTLSIGSAVFNNAAGATLTAGAGSTLDIGYAGNSWSNAGTITATGDKVDFNGVWTNTGTLDVTNSTVNLGASLTGATLNQFAGQGNSIVISGTVANASNVLSVGAGTGLGAVALDGGTITGGTIADAGGGLSFGNAMLDGVTYQGTLDLSTPSSRLTVKGGITLTGAGGAGGGTINLTGTYCSLSILGGLTLTEGSGVVATIDLTGASSSLALAGTQTLDNATVTLGSSAGYAVLGVTDDGGPAGLILGRNLKIVGSGLYASIDSTSPDATILNEGSISATASGGQFNIGSGALAFVNTGSLSVSNGDTLTIEASTCSNAAGGTITAATGSTLNFSGGNWTNAGKVTANGATLNFDGPWLNTGTFAVANSTVNLGASGLTDARLELFGGGGNSIGFSGQLANGGETLSVGSGTALGTVVIDGGTIIGGTIADSGGGFSFVNATLKGVAYQGALDLSAAGSDLTVDAGTTFAGAGGSGPGTIELTGAASVLIFAGTQTLTNATIDIGNNSVDPARLEVTNIGSRATLTLGANLNLVVTGPNASIYLAGTAMVNDTTISATVSGGEFSIGGQGASFTNSGSLSVSNGDTIVISVANLTNLSHATLTGGVYEADANSVIQINQKGEIITDDAEIILSGPGSNILSQEHIGRNYYELTIDNSLTTIGASGVLKLVGGRNFTTTAAFTDAGALILGGSIFTANGLTVSSGGSLSGSGAVAAAIANSGLIEASGGTLTLQDAVTGNGGLKIDAGATLTLGSTLAAGGTATFNGASADLAITAVSSFADTIGGLAATDEIDLLKTAATAAVVNASNQLVVTNNGAAVATFALSGSNSGLAFTTETDNNGGTFIVAGAAPAPHANIGLFRQYVAAGFGDHVAPLIDRQDHLQMAQPHHDFAAGR